MSVSVRQGPPKVTVYPGGSLAGAIELDRQVVSLQCSGSVMAPSYKWSVGLLPRTGEDEQTPGDVRRAAMLYKTLRPNQVVSLGFQERGGITMGLIDTVTRNVSHAGGKVAYGLTVTGRGMGKVLELDTIIRATLTVAEYPYYRARIIAALGENPIVYDVPGVWGIESRDGVPTFLSVTVKEVIDFILTRGSTMQVPLLAGATGGTGRVSDYMRTDYSVTTWHGARIFSETHSDYQGTLWGFIRSILDADLYECWVDTVPPLVPGALPTIQLVIRPKPFDEPAFEFAPVEEETGLTWDELRTMVDGLPHHEIDLSEVFSESLGISDADAYAHYVVTSQQDLIANAEAEARGLYYPLTDTFMAKKFGMRKYDARLTLVGPDVVKRAEGDEDYIGEISTEVHEARNRLFNWYRANPWFENGQIVVHGRDRYRPGDPVLLPWVEPALGGQRGLRFYCPSVSWAWSYGGHYTSTLSLTRGHNAAMMQALEAEILADAPAANPNHYAST